MGLKKRGGGGEGGRLLKQKKHQRQCTKKIFIPYNSLLDYSPCTRKETSNLPSFILKKYTAGSMAFLAELEFTGINAGVRYVNSAAQLYKHTESKPTYLPAK